MHSTHLSQMIKSQNKIIYMVVNIYFYVCGQCRTIYAAKFEQTIIHQHVLLRRESQSHILLRRASQSETHSGFHDLFLN
jgi:hypothetical protein